MTWWNFFSFYFSCCIFPYILFAFFFILTEWFFVETRADRLLQAVHVIQPTPFLLHLLFLPLLTGAVRAIPPCCLLRLRLTLHVRHGAVVVIYKAHGPQDAVWPASSPATWAIRRPPHPCHPVFSSFSRSSVQFAIPWVKSRQLWRTSMVWWCWNCVDAWNNEPFSEGKNGQSINQSIDTTHFRSTKEIYSSNQAINWATSHEVRLYSINQSTNQSINQSINQPTNQSINRSINQSTNQPINRRHAVPSWSFF